MRPDLNSRHRDKDLVIEEHFRNKRTGTLVILDGAGSPKFVPVFTRCLHRPCLLSAAESSTSADNKDKRIVVVIGELSGVTIGNLHWLQSIRHGA
jgi:hypothetical protein